MKALYYTILLTLLIFTFGSCVKRKPEIPADTQEVTIEEAPGTPARQDETYDPRKQLEALGMDNEVRREQQAVQVVNPKDYSRLKKYSVIVAALAQPKGVEALKGFFDRDGIQYFVVKGPSGLNYFVLHSADTEEEALRARADFLIKNTVNKSREDIWRQYYIQLTDTFILEKK